MTLRQEQRVMRRHAPRSRAWRRRSAMQLLDAARNLAALVQANNTTALRTAVVAEVGEGFRRAAIPGGLDRAEGGGRTSDGGPGLPAGREQPEAECGRIGAGCAVLLLAKPVDDGGGVCNSGTASGKVRVCDGDGGACGGCGEARAVAAVVPDAAGAGQSGCSRASIPSR